MIGKLARGGFAGALLRWASGLRFPLLFALALLVFALDLFFPDMLPLVDELMLGLLALLLARLKKPTDGASDAAGDSR